MINSILVNEAIYAMLSGSTALTQEVSTKIYPLIANAKTTYPYVVFQRNDISPSYCKDGGLADKVSIEIITVAADYSQSLTIANEIRRTLENKRFENTDIEIDQIKLTQVREAYNQDAYVQYLNFDVEVVK